MDVIELVFVVIINKRFTFHLKYMTIVFVYVNRTSLFEIVSKINELVKEEKMDAKFYEWLLICAEYRRSLQLSEEFSSLKKKKSSSYIVITYSLKGSYGKNTNGKNSSSFATLLITVCTH